MNNNAITSAATPAFLIQDDAKVEIIRRGEGRPILFLHSEFGLEAGHEILDRLADHHAVIAPLHPGFGHSELPRHFSGIDDLAYFYLNMLRDLDLQDVVIVGVSFGAWIAAEIAVKSCERISAVILAGPVGIKIGKPDEIDVVDMFAVDAKHFTSLAFADPAKAIDYTQLTDEGAEIAARNRDAVALYGWLPYMYDPKLASRLGRIAVPTLVIKGEEDGIITERYAQEYVALIPNAVLKRIPDCGHFIDIEQPAALARLTQTFVA